MSGLFAKLHFDGHSLAGAHGIGSLIEAAAAAGRIQDVLVPLERVEGDTHILGLPPPPTVDYGASIYDHPADTLDHGGDQPDHGFAELAHHVLDLESPEPEFSHFSQANSDEVPDFPDSLPIVDYGASVYDSDPEVR